MKRKFRLTRKQQNMIMIPLLVIGFLLLIYPDISNWYHRIQHDFFLQEYSDEVARMAEAELEYELGRAIAHNLALGGIDAVDPFAPGSGSVLSMEYYNILNLRSTMGRIEIPAINVNLPIFHGTSDEVLYRGVGHIEHTPFPVGGIGNHSILSAHTGLVHARMFNDLNLLDIDDIFIITILNNRIAYKVDQIDIVLPHQIEVLVNYDDRDLVTLVTCTPYGINSHRLLVRGTRTDYIPDMADDIASIVSPINIRLLIIIGFFIFFVLMIILYRRKQDKMRDKMRDKIIEKEYQDWERKESQLSAFLAKVR